MIKVSWSWTLDVVNNGVMSLGEWYDEHTPKLSITIRSSHLVYIVISFIRSNLISLDHEIMSITNTGRVLWCHQTSHRHRVTIKVSLGIWKVLVEAHGSRVGFVHPNTQRHLYSHPVTVWRLMTSKHSSRISNWHDLMV